MVFIKFVVKRALKQDQILHMEGETSHYSLLQGSVTVDTTEEVSDEEDTGPSPIDMSFPTGQGCWKIFLYLISLPLMGPMYITLPDTRNPKCKKFFVVTFLGSIIWIAAFSYLMVWWATVVGQVAGIPPAVSQYIVYSL